MPAFYKHVEVSNCSLAADLVHLTQQSAVGAAIVAVTQHMEAIKALDNP